MFIIAVVLLFTVISAGAASKPLGDIDSNGKVEAEDARSALRYSVGLDTPSAAQKKAADADRDGSVTSADARLILRMSVNLENLIYYTVADEPETPKKPDSPQAAAFKSVLYNVGHKYYNNSKGYGSSFAEIHPLIDSNHSPLEMVYGTAGKWCCYYTIHDVFRPALRQAGYSEARIEQLAPMYFPKKTISTALTNIIASETNDYKDVSAKIKIPASLVPSDIVPFYIPSVLMDYYQNASSDICTTYTLHEYYDDVVTDSLIKRSSNAASYKPQVGDVIFMSNKSRTYSHGYPTVDHTAQIIAVEPDGRFLCTEGSIIISDKPDELPRVRERWYYYNRTERTYFYVNNSIVFVLAAVRPNL